MNRAREVLVCVSRSSGGIKRGQSEADEIRGALAAAGVEAQVELHTGAGIVQRAKAAVDEGADLLIVGGGDGSVSAAAGALAGSGTALGILPLGTLNHFARDLGIPLKLADAHWLPLPVRMIVTPVPVKVVPPLRERVPRSMM